MKFFKNYILSATGIVAQRPFLGKQVRDFFPKYRPVRDFKRPLRKRTSFPFQIFIYHRVLPRENIFSIDPISVKDFDRQLDILHRFFRVVSLQQAVREQAEGTLQPNTVCITFDDGYKDNFDFAFPILKKYHLPATIFLTTNYIGGEELLWHDRVLAIFENAKIKNLTYEKSGIVNVDMTQRERREHAAFQFLSWLKKIPPKIRDSRILEMKEICQSDAMPSQRMMLHWDEVRIMHGEQIDFGAHTKSHPILAYLDAEELNDEIIGSKEAIENHLHVPVKSFAYPNGGVGDFNDSIKALLRKAGFQCAVSTIYGLNNSSQDVYELLRCPPWDRNANRFYGRLLFERFFDAPKNSNP